MRRIACPFGGNSAGQFRVSISGMASGIAQRATGTIAAFALSLCAIAPGVCAALCNLDTCCTEQARPLAACRCECPQDLSSAPQACCQAIHPVANQESVQAKSISIVHEYSAILPGTSIFNVGSVSKQQPSLARRIASPPPDTHYRPDSPRGPPLS